MCPLPDPGRRHPERLMRSHCEQINAAIRAGDYAELSFLLSLFGTSSVCSASLSDGSLGGLVQAVAVIEDDHWREVALNHLRAVKASAAGDIAGRFECQLDMVQVFLRDIFCRADRTMLPLLYVLTKDLWSTVTQSEAEEEAARAINRAFTLCITDRSPLDVSRRHGTFAVLSLLFTIYFHRQKLNLCVQLLRAVRTAELPAESEFPASHTTPYHYYHGRFLSSSGKYSDACEELLTALKMAYSAQSFHDDDRGCDRAHDNRKCCRDDDDNSNVKRVLRFYIPNHVLKYPHRMPKLSGIDKVMIDGFTSILAGNMVAFKAFLRDNFEWLARHYLLFHFQKFEIILIRNLVRKIYMSANQNTRLPLDVVFRAGGGEKTWSGGVLGLAAHLCGIISTGAIRGYVSYEPSYLVLSKKNPFPPYTLA